MYAHFQRFVNTLETMSLTCDDDFSEDFDWNKLNRSQTWCDIDMRRISRYDMNPRSKYRAYISNECICLAI